MDEKTIEKIKEILDDFPELLIADISGPVYFDSVPEDKVVDFAAIRSRSGEIVYLVPTVRDYQEYVLLVTTENIPTWFKVNRLKEVWEGKMDTENLIDKEKVRAWLAERYRQELLANRALKNKKAKDLTLNEITRYQNRTVRMLELFDIIQWLDRQGVRDG